MPQQGFPYINIYVYIYIDIIILGHNKSAIAAAAWNGI